MPPPTTTRRALRPRTARSARRATLLVLAAPLLAIGVAAAPAARATFPGENGRIVFDTAESPDGPQIYTVNPDGSDLLQLTHLRHGAAFMPRWSADGLRIAYVSDASGNDEVWTMRWDGTRKRQVTDEPGIGHYWPTWTPNGRIVFSRCDYTAFGTCTISTVRRDGSHLRTIVGGHWHHGQPAVSPDGSWIAFTSDKGGYDGRLWLVHPDGTDLHLVGEPPALFADRPDWSPDGSLITFTGDPHAGMIFTIRPDGSDLNAISPAGRIFASFSPDGTRMVLLVDVDCDCRTLGLSDTDGNLLGTVASLPGVAFSDWGVAA